VRGFFAGSGPKRRAQPGPVKTPPTWRQLADEARKTRWLWTLPVESGYASSLIEVQREWSLDDVLLVADRLAEKAEAAERARQQAERGRR
jgi:hypothetical protein